ncbi:peptidoglycan-recognition protein 1 [Trichonephila clavata]|uniref:Peptidoglycan-recognition protein n=1 Tax=Trichonephila clavata TaxID=2740835 RepID=A0A8X6F4P0_TRICU|nr:peptidoglycan-recognition protein 1 [Trichonephila clavata]
MVFRGRKIILVFISHLLFVTLSSACPGLELVIRSQWSARAPSQRWFFVSTPVEHVIIGHTATAPCLSQESCAAQMRSIQKYHMELGWGDIGYNFVIGGDGRVYEGVGWSRQGVHTLGWNTKSYGIAFIGDYSQMRPSAKQLKAARYLMICGTQMGLISSGHKIHGARDATCTDSPGDKLYEIIARWPMFEGGPLVGYKC